MQHRSGFRDCGTVLGCLQSGFTQANFDKRSYENGRVAIVAHRTYPKPVTSQVRFGNEQGLGSF